MQHGAVAELLARSPMLCGLGSELLSAIILRGDMVRFDAGQPVTLAGTPADSAFFILEGRVALPEQGAEDKTPSLEPGSAISEMAMFVEMDHYHNSIALEDVTALQISRELMGHLVFERPVLAECFANNIRNNLTNVALLLQELDAELSASSLPEPELDTGSGDMGYPLLPAPAMEPEAANTLEDFQLPELHELEVDMFGAENGEDSGAHEGAQVRDIMSELSQFSLPPSQSPPEPEHDQTVFPSL